MLSAELHLLHYHKQRLAYLKSYYATRPRGQLKLGQQARWVPLRNFSKPEMSGVATHVAGYDNRSISDDLITDVFSKFSEQTRQAESEESLRSKTGEYFRQSSHGPRVRVKGVSYSSILITHLQLSLSPSTRHSAPPTSRRLWRRTRHVPSHVRGES